MSSYTGFFLLLCIQTINVRYKPTRERYCGNSYAQCIYKQISYRWVIILVCFYDGYNRQRWCFSCIVPYCVSDGCSWQLRFINQIKIENYDEYILDIHCTVLNTCECCQNHYHALLRNLKMYMTMYFQYSKFSWISILMMVLHGRIV